MRYRHKKKKKSKSPGFYTGGSGANHQFMLSDHIDDVSELPVREENQNKSYVQQESFSSEELRITRLIRKDVLVSIFFASAIITSGATLYFIYRESELV